LQDDTEENRQTVAGYLDAIQQEVPQVRPTDVGLFAGVMDPKKLSFLPRLVMKSLKSPQGDFRNWQAIRAWAHQVRPVLLGKS
jgi:menaquinone-dependent protoporphyrinogen oxidase